MKNMWKRAVICCAALILLCGCAYRYYLGLHGPSVNAFPEIHEGITDDRDCLGCHDADNNPAAPPTSHPGFTGCLKCHNDEVP